MIIKNTQIRLIVNQVKPLSQKIKCENATVNPNLSDKIKPIDNISAHYYYKGDPPKFETINKRFDVTGNLTSPIDKTKENKKKEILGNRENIFQKEDGVINKIDEISKEDLNQESSSKVDKSPEDLISS
jgi:hypothetical protein